MGITGLLPFLEKSSKKGNISQFSGGTVAIDSYCWLHKGAFSCADKLVMGQHTDAYVKYCMKYVQMLLDANIKPILVFDGRHLNAKAETEVKRRESRKNNRKKGAELMRMGNTAEGRNLLRRSLDITHKMALELIKACQKDNIDCIVAPYEADAQLAYLNISGIADVVITEDSDLTLFGCKKIFFKMDINGNGVLVEQDRLHMAMGVQPELFSMDKFRYMCILSGCDYLPSLPGIGLMKACKFISKILDSDIQKALPRMGAYLNMKSLIVTKEYIDSFIKADITFKHQLVYCPLQRKQTRLYQPSNDVTEDQLKFAGEEMSDEELAWQVALGNYDPFTLEKLHDFDPDQHITKRRTNSWAQQPLANHESIWSRGFDVDSRKIVSSKSPLTLPNLTGKVTFVKPNIRKQSGKRSYDEYDDMSDKDLLKMYVEDIEKDKLISAKPNCDKDESDSKEQKSPVVTRSRSNPFKKVMDENSPSYLSKGRKRCMLRFKPTVIDDSVTVQSKFFTPVNDTKTEHSVEEVSIILDKNKQVDSSKYKEINNKDSDMIVEDISTNEVSLKDNIMTDSEILIKHDNNRENSLLKIEDSGQETMEVDGNVETQENFTESIDYVKLYKQDFRENNNTSPTNSDKDDYFSIDDIPQKSNLFQWNNPKLNTNNESINKTKSSHQSRRSLTRQSSTKKMTSKKLEPVAGQSLLNQFGFQKRTVLKQ